MQNIPIIVLKETPSLVKIKLVGNQRIIDVPKRVFDKRVDVGLYEVKNANDLPTVI